MKYLRHQVVKMDESMVQCCVICGEVICDYRNVGRAFSITSSGVLKEDKWNPSGFNEGSVYISLERYPMKTCLIDFDDTFQDCN